MKNFQSFFKFDKNLEKISLCSSSILIPRRFFIKFFIIFYLIFFICFITWYFCVFVTWFFLYFVFCILRYICIRSVYVLTSEFPSLTVTLVVTLRKFISLLISIWYFRNPFTLMHWAGTAMVFSGTLLFSEVHMQIFALTKKSTRKEK